MSEVANKLGRALPVARNRDATAFNLSQWLMSEGVGISAGLTGAEREETAALAAETDPELLGHALLVLAGRLEISEKLDQALAFYQLLASHPNWSSPGCSGLRKAAQTQLEGIQGQGGTGARTEFLLRRFTREASDPRMIVPMMAGTAVYSLVRSAGLSRLLASSQSGFLTRGFGARLTAGTLGFVAEVPTFALSSRALRGLGHPPSTHPEPGIGQELASAAITLGVLKFTGAGTQALLAKTGNPHHRATNILLSQGSIFVGLIGAHKLEERLGLRPTHPDATLVTDTLASMFSLGVGAHLGRRVLGRGYERFQASLSLRAESHWSEQPCGPTGGEFGDHNHLALAGLGKKLPSEEAPVPHLYRPRELFDPLKPMHMGETPKWKEFQEGFKEIRSNPAALNPKSRQSLADSAKNTWREFPKYRLKPFWHAHLALRDFAKLRQFADELMSRLPQGWVLQENWSNLVLAHLVLQDYKTVFKLLRHPTTDSFGKGHGDSVDLESNVIADIEIRNSYILDYAARKGFQKFYHFDLVPTLRDLVSLSQNYDFFIGVARGGLYSASVADLLGFPNAVMEVHAHGRRKAKSAWIDAVSEEQIAGKRVLLLDKDAVTGATVQEAVRLLKPLKPAGVGIYFNHGPRKREFVSFPISSHGGMVFKPRMMQVSGRLLPEVLPLKAVKRIENAGVAIHYPENVEENPVEPTFYAAHERINTPLGRLNQVFSLFYEDILNSARDMDPHSRLNLIHRWVDFVEFEGSLNPLVPGAANIRESIVSLLHTTVTEFKNVLTSGLRDLRDPATYELLAGMLGQDGIRESMAEEFARARYHPWGLRLARDRGIRLEHTPQNYSSAFRAAQDALQSGHYEIALIVGPEGFAYEPIFRDLGVPTVALNIPEADFGGRRSLKKLEDLSVLKGKRVLVVEDDIRSGATLQRLLRGIKAHGPFAELGLYLGLPSHRQLWENIPEVFQNVFISDPHPEKDQVAFMEHFSEREKIWKVSKD